MIFIDWHLVPTIMVAIGLTGLVPVVFWVALYCLVAFVSVFTSK